jgi:hypothetical protein
MNAASPQQNLDNDLANSVNGAADELSAAAGGAEASSTSGMGAASSNAAAKPAQDASAEAPSGAAGRGMEKRKQRTRNLIRTKDATSGDVLKKIGDYLVPIMGIMVFGLLIAFVYVPFGTDALDKNREVQALQEEIDWTGEKISTLKSINLDELNSKNDTVEEVVRDEMDVSDMAAQVEEIAIYNNLKPKELTFSNKEVSTSVVRSDRVSASWAPEFAESISGPFAFYGEFDDIVSFLNELRNISPTVLFIDAVNISEYAIKDEEGNVVEGDLWSVDINIFGYTCPLVESVAIKDPVEVGGYDELMKDIEKRIEAKEEREEMLYGGPQQDEEDNNYNSGDNGDNEEDTEEDNQGNNGNDEGAEEDNTQDEPSI